MGYHDIYFEGGCPLLREASCFMGCYKLSVCHTYLVDIGTFALVSLYMDDISGAILSFEALQPNCVDPLCFLYLMLNLYVCY